jgi:hypothetical protein
MVAVAPSECSSTDTESRLACIVIIITPSSHSINTIGHSMPNVHFNNSHNGSNNDLQLGLSTQRLRMPLQKQTTEYAPHSKILPPPVA